MVQKTVKTLGQIMMRNFAQNQIRLQTHIIMGIIGKDGNERSDDLSCFKTPQLSDGLFPYMMILILGGEMDKQFKKSFGGRLPHNPQGHFPQARGGIMTMAPKRPRLESGI